MIILDKHTTVDVSLSTEMAEELRPLLHKAMDSGCGQVEIVARTEYQYERQD